MPDIGPGYCVTHKMYVSRSQSRYMSDLLPGAYVMGIFGDVADELCSRLDCSEALLASYSDVQFTAPVLVGDIIEVTGELLEIGTKSRQIGFTARIIGRRVSTSAPARDEAGILAEPLVAATARGVAVTGGEY